MHSYCCPFILYIRFVFSYSESKSVISNYQITWKLPFSQRIEHQRCRGSGVLYFNSVSNGNKIVSKQIHMSTGIDNPQFLPWTTAESKWLKTKQIQEFCDRCWKWGGCINTWVFWRRVFVCVYIKVWTQFLGNINRKNSKTVLETSWKLLAF